MKEGDDQVAMLEQQLADLAVDGSDAAEVLVRLAEAVFPGGMALGDPSRLLWPESERAQNPGSSRDGSGTGVGGRTEPPDPRGNLAAQIRRSEIRYRSLVEQLPAVVFYAALGEDENEVYVSPQIETLLGFTQKEWLTNPLLWFSQMHPDDHDTVIEAFTKGVQTGAPFRAEVRFFSRDGDEVWILGEARLIRDEAQRPAYFQGVAFDITMTKRAQESMAQAAQAQADAAQMRAEAFAARNLRLRQHNRELMVAKEAAEAAAQARTTFLTTMSHELRTPLNSVIVLAGLLADEALTLTQHDLVRRMRLASDHLLELINDVLEFSRLRAGQVQLDVRTFDLLGWIDDTLEMVAPRAAEKGLELRLVVAGSVPAVVTADEGRLRQVLLNLLGNAVKFTATGFVEVRVAAALQGDGRWELQCSVHDTGMGIRAQDAATLFDEFRQADSGIAREFGGTGLGLAICKHLCELLDGRIWVEQPDGIGATVAFTWLARAEGDAMVAPLVRRGALPATAVLGPTAGATRPRPPTSDLRILIAEDNLMNQQVATLLLGALGYVADVVANGDDAIAAVQAKAYDVVLMDIAMPGTDGLSATRAIRDLETTIRQPYIVALTAHAFPGDADVCFEAGMDDYVTKPIDRALLSRALIAGAQRAESIQAGSIQAGSNQAGSNQMGSNRAGERVAAGSTAALGTGSAGAAGSAQVAEAPAAGTELDFDPALATEIQTEFGWEPLSQLVAIFRTEATRLVAAAATAVAEGDLVRAETAAHTLKSGAANLGARGLYAKCSQLERLTRSGSQDGATLATAVELTGAMATQLADALERLDGIVAPPALP